MRWGVEVVDVVQERFDQGGSGGPGIALVDQSLLAPRPGQNSACSGCLARCAVNKRGVHYAVVVLLCSFFRSEDFRAAR